jgi:hypothetical protein
MTTTQSTADGQGNIAVTASLATTQAIDMRAMRTAFIRSSVAITVTFFASRDLNGTYKAIKLSGHLGANHTQALVDEYQPMDADLFPVHYLKLVSGSDAASIEIMGKA